MNRHWKSMVEAEYAMMELYCVCTAHNYTMIVFIERVEKIYRYCKFQAEKLRHRISISRTGYSYVIIAPVIIIYVYIGHISIAIW